jgi:hypothetical protein
MDLSIPPHKSAMLVLPILKSVAPDSPSSQQPATRPYPKTPEKNPPPAVLPTLGILLYDFKEDSNGITSIANFVQIC